METPRVIDAAFWAGGAARLMEPGPAGMFDWVASQDALGGQVLFRTSGSTGEGKWVGLSVEALRSSAVAVNEHLAVGSGDVWGRALPERHVGGFGVEARGYFSGTRVERYAGKWEAGEFCRWLARTGVTLVTMVPTQVVDLVAGRHPAPGPVRAVVVGGGALDEAVGEAARALGWPVLASFGMTEAGSQVATAGLSQLGERFAAGRLPLLGPWDARVDVDGRLALRGTPLFSGYVVAAGAGWEFLPRTGDWFQTSDHVALDGRLVTPLGRADRRVKVLGELVDLDEIHRALGKFIAPGGWSVVDLPDPRRGARIVLVTESAPPGPEMLADIAAYQAQAPGPERLAATAVVPEFPRSALGKLRVAELRRIAAGCANNL